MLAGDLIRGTRPDVIRADHEEYNGLLYYPTFYEGLEQSKNVIYTGQEATQQILASLDCVASWPV
jgi:hypothetical protein